MASDINVWSQAPCTHAPSHATTWNWYSNYHHVACFEAMEGFHLPPPAQHAALSLKCSVVSFATLHVGSCLHSPALRRSCCNVARLYCHLEAHMLRFYPYFNV
jgi:hypothetical protein